MLWVMHLDTPRLLFRCFRSEDLAAIHAFASDPEVTRYTDWGPNTLDGSRAFLAETAVTDRERPQTRFAFALIRKEDDGLVGSAELRVTDLSASHGQIGYTLARPWWGHGYATEAATALLYFGFGHLELKKISATCDPDNTASAHVLTKIGMRQQERLPRHLHLRGSWRDRLVFTTETSTG